MDTKPEPEIKLSNCKRDSYHIDMFSIQNIRSDVVKPPFDYESNKKHDVILSAYMNSGSRYTGQLLGFRNESFFFYEPLWRFSIWDYYRPADIQCSSTVGSCRTVKTTEVNSYQLDQRNNALEKVIDPLPSDIQPIELMLYILSNILRCDLVSLKYLIQERVHDHPNYAGPSWRKYTECLLKFNPKSKCLSDLEQICKKKSHRIIKVLRLTAGTFRPLLKTNPRLSIIHLVRDPRAIIHSRLFSRFYPSTTRNNNDSLERNLCDKMLDDVIEVKRLQEDFPGRVHIVYYEDLNSENYVTLKHLYNFLDLNFNESEVKSLAQVKINLAPPERGSNFTEDRKNHNTFWWRKHMKWETIKRVDNVCYKVYYELGYKILSKSQVGDLTYNSLEIPPSLQL
ncbi:hypothetical protein ACF0H5_013015 [Mactra antiquata]